jgi:phage-related protein
VEGKKKTKRRRLRWRDYRTAASARPVKAFLDGLTDEDAAAVVAGMKDVSHNGLAAARHVRDEIYEVRAEGTYVIYRILFAQETKFILLSLTGFTKKTQKTPDTEIDLAERRLTEWRSRARRRKAIASKLSH